MSGNILRGPLGGLTLCCVIQSCDSTSLSLDGLIWLTGNESQRPDVVNSKRISWEVGKGLVHTKCLIRAVNLLPETMSRAAQLCPACFVQILHLAPGAVVPNLPCESETTGTF